MGGVQGDVVAHREARIGVVTQEQKARHYAMYLTGMPIAFSWTPVLWTHIIKQDSSSLKGEVMMSGPLGRYRT